MSATTCDDCQSRILHDMRPLKLAAETADAYSADIWGPVAWCEAALMLCDMGLSDDEVRGVLRSKLTRWARDAYSEPSTYLGVLCQQVMVLRRENRLHEYAETEATI
jgi:hypothetical protein